MNDKIPQTWLGPDELCRYIGPREVPGPEACVSRDCMYCMGTSWEGGGLNSLSFCFAVFTFALFTFVFYILFLCFYFRFYYPLLTFAFLFISLLFNNLCLLLSIYCKINT